MSHKPQHSCTIANMTSVILRKYTYLFGRILRVCSAYFMCFFMRTARWFGAVVPNTKVERNCWYIPVNMNIFIDVVTIEHTYIQLMYMKCLNQIYNVPYNIITYHINTKKLCIKFKTPNISRCNSHFHTPVSTRDWSACLWRYPSVRQLCAQ